MLLQRCIWLQQLWVIKPVFVRTWPKFSFVEFLSTWQYFHCMIVLFFMSLFIHSAHHQGADWRLQIRKGKITFPWQNKAEFRTFALLLLVLEGFSFSFFLLFNMNAITRPTGQTKLFTGKILATATGKMNLHKVICECNFISCFN